MKLVELVKCRCGGEAKYVSSWGMDDQYVCSSCDYKTHNYFDGAEYAMAEWQKRNDPNHVSDESRMMKGMRELLERQSKVNVLRPPKRKKTLGDR